MLCSIYLFIYKQPGDDACKLLVANETDNTSVTAIEFINITITSIARCVEDLGTLMVH
jgi:hypothetical protein